MSIEGQITSISEFLVCQSEQCQQSISICSRSYFGELHNSLVNGKKKTHQSVTFPDSGQYYNFISINRLHFILTKKIKQAVRGLPTDIDTLVQTALYRSDTFRDLFMNSDQAIQQYFYLLQIHRGNPMPFAYYFSEDFCNSISIPNQKGVTKLYKQLCGYSPEWNFLNVEFNYASGINSGYLEAFMEQEIAYFSSYCIYVTEHKKEFNIREYTSIRNSSKDYKNDPFYYSPEFVSFLIEKYQKNPGASEIFNLKEYYLYFWQYFSVLIDNSKNINKYFEEQVSFYHDYEKEMAEQKLDETFLGFRMWRLNRKTSNYLPSLKNPFFLQTFIYSFIEELIEKKLFAPEEKRNENYKEFAKFLHDFVLFVEEKKEEFNFGRYREYASFRRNKAVKLQQNLRIHKDIVFDMKFFLEYVHNEFSEGNTLALKKYKKYQEKRSEQEEEKFRKFTQNTDALKSELVAEEKHLFYEILFNSFLEQAKDNRMELTKSAYKEFKQNILESVDETYIQEKEAEYKHSIMEINEEGEKEKESPKKKEKGKTVVEEEINEEEEEMAELIKDQQNSEASSDEEERDREENCPCCKGRPYECQEPECKILGCCSACMLGD